MNAKTTEQRTAVFTPCAESAEATRAFPVSDEDTKELPLIADRFAGRYWDSHADEAPERNPARKQSFRSALAFGAAACEMEGWQHLLAHHYYVLRHTLALTAKCRSTRFLHLYLRFLLKGNPQPPTAPQA